MVILKPLLWTVTPDSFLSYHNSWIVYFLNNSSNIFSAKYYKTESMLFYLFFIVGNKTRLLEYSKSEVNYHIHIFVILEYRVKLCCIFMLLLSKLILKRNFTVMLAIPTSGIQWLFVHFKIMATYNLKYDCQQLKNL